MQYFGAQSRAYDTDIIQLFEALADFTQPIELKKKPRIGGTIYRHILAANEASHVKGVRCHIGGGGVQYTCLIHWPL